MERFDSFRRFYLRGSLGACHVPVASRRLRLRHDEALDIAMNYLERTEQAVKFFEVQRVAAMAIVAALLRKSGRHPCRVSG